MPARACVPRTSDRSREIYARRTAVERCWARLKEEWGLLDLRVRRLDRVAQHFSLVILAYSLLRLAKLRASP
jgi:Transposase DDE domain